MNEISHNNDSKSEFKLLERIIAPRKKDFRIIKDKLPKNRFSSVDKIMTNSSYMDDRDKENNPNLSNSVKIDHDSIKLIKKQTLPSINRPSSASGVVEAVKNPNNQVQVIEPQGKPPLPNRALRA